MTILIKKIKLIQKSIIESSLIRSSTVYTLASFLNASIPFLLLPILTKHLTKTDFGIITMFTTVIGFTMPFIGINMEGAIGRKYFDSNINIPKYIGNCLIILTASSFIVIISFIFFQVLISNYTGIPADWLILIPLFCIFQFINSLRLTLWQVSTSPIKYSAFQIIQSIINFLLTLIFVIALEMNWQGRMISMVLTIFIASVFAIFSLTKDNYLNFKIEKSYILHALKFGGGLIPHVLGGSLIIMTSRLFLTNMVNIEQTGLYGIAQMITGIIGFFTISFNNAYVPYLFEKLNKNSITEKKKIVRITYLYFISISILGLLFYLILPLLFRIIVSKSFNEAYLFCTYLIIGYVFQGMYFMVTNYISFVEKTHIQAVITIFVGIINIPLNYILIQYYGAIGAAMAFSAIFFLFFIITWILSAKLFYMPWNLKQIQ